MTVVFVLRQSYLFDTDSQKPGIYTKNATIKMPTIFLISEK